MRWKEQLVLIGILLVCSMAYGQTTWKRTYGGFSVEEGHSIKQVADSGYIVCGSTGSFGNGGDIYLVKLDSLGVREWSKNYGSIQADQGWAVELTPSGGYAVASTANTSSQSLNGGLMLLDDLGNVIWDRSYGTSDWDLFYDLEVLTDGYIMTGQTYGYGGSIGRTWVVRTDLSGDTLWTTAQYMGTNSSGRCIRATPDGGAVVTGSANTLNGDTDAFLFKLNANGMLEWEVMVGGIEDDISNTVTLTSNGDYVIGGYTRSFSSHQEMMLARIDPSGNVIWIRNIYGLDEWEGREIYELDTGGFVMAGHTNAIGAGGYDFYLLFTDNDGYWVSGPSIGGPSDDICWGMDKTYDGGYVMVGTTKSYGPGISSVFVVKTDGNIVNTPVIVDLDPLPVDEASRSIEAFKIYPNPVTLGHPITIVSEEWGRSARVVELRDISGRSVGDNFLSPGQSSLSIYGIGVGVYLVKMKNGSGELIGTQRLVISPE